MQPTTPLRSFFAALAQRGIGPTSIPAELNRIARHLGRGGDDAEVDDVVGDFLLRLIEATRRSTSGSAEFLADLDEQQLRAVVRHRMRQVVAERSPRRHLVKQLRDAVRRVVARGLPPVPASPPVSLMHNDKLHAGRVADAVAWSRNGEDAAGPQSIAGIAERLCETYFHTTVSGLSEATEPATDVDPVDIKKVVSRLRAELDADLLQAARARLRDRSLGEISTMAGIAVSSAHARVARAVTAVRSIIEQVGVDRATGEAALALLAA